VRRGPASFFARKRSNRVIEDCPDRFRLPPCMPDGDPAVAVDAIAAGAGFAAELHGPAAGLAQARHQPLQRCGGIGDCAIRRMVISVSSSPMRNAPSNPSGLTLPRLKPLSDALYREAAANGVIFQPTPVALSQAVSRKTSDRGGLGAHLEWRNPSRRALCIGEGDVSLTSLSATSFFAFLP
jgi:hypothetical protein